MHEEYGNSRFRFFRAQMKAVYHSVAFQSLAAVAIVAGLAFGVAEAQVLPEKAEPSHESFYYMVRAHGS
jgi:hypothetical protein